MTPKVSIIIPVYNVEKYLRQCLDSVLNQTLNDIEVICVDDSSTDKSVDILKEYQNKDNRIVIVAQENTGAGAARNNGMQYAKGEYLFFMDSDDFCEKNFLEKTVAEADKKETDILVFDYYKYDENTRQTEYRNGLVKRRVAIEKETFSYKDKPKTICLAVNPTPWNKLYRRSFVEKTGLKWLEVSTTNDITFATMSVLMAERIAYIEEAFIYYRIALKHSITSRKKYNQDNVIKAVLAVAEQASRLDYFPMVKNSVREFVVSNLKNALNSYTTDKDSPYYIDFEEKIDSIFFSHPVFLACEEKDFVDKKLFEFFIMCKSRAFMKKDDRYLPEVIVSFTSFPGRINTIYKTVASIYRQSRKPDRMILWLAESQFPEKENDIPESLREYMSKGLEIRWCQDDIRPHKKYYYAMQEYPDALIITIDDDLIYDEHMVEMLVESYIKFPSAVSSVRAHLMMADSDGNIDSYTQWIKEFSGVVDIPSLQLFSTSGAGTLYPPGCMDKQVFNIENIKNLCLNADDIWLKVMQLLKGTPTVLVRRNIKLNYVQDTQKDALQNINVNKHGNDIQLKNTLDVYDPERVYICRALSENYNRETDLSKKNTLTKAVSDDKNKESLMYYELKIKSLQKELQSIKQSFSYKFACIITFVPRKIRGGIRCYRDNGMKYTIKRCFQKLSYFLNKK